MVKIVGLDRLVCSRSDLMHVCNTVNILPSYIYIYAYIHKYNRDLTFSIIYVYYLPSDGLGNRMYAFEYSSWQFNPKKYSFIVLKNSKIDPVSRFVSELVLFLLFIYIYEAVHIMGIMHNHLAVCV